MFDIGGEYKVVGFKNGYFGGGGAGVDSEDVSFSHFI